MSYPLYLSQGWSKLAEEVDAELAKARKKFPNSKLCTTALSEEYGEAIRAVLEHYYDPCARNREDVRKELVQTIAMCIRLELEGDSVHNLTPGLE